MTAKTRRYFETGKDIVQVLANVAVIIAVIFAAVQIADYRVKGSAELALVFEEYLDADPDLSISQFLDTSSTAAKVFEPDGPFTVNEIERYIGTFETLGDLYQHGLIGYDMMETSFAYYILKANENDEIRNYIADSRRENPRWWSHFVKLAETFDEEK